MPRSLTNLNAGQLHRRAEIGAQRRQKTRGKLMEAAYRLFAVYGADAPTIDDVIADAGTARGTFYNHFNSRDTLFRAVADEIATSVNAIIAAALTDVADPATRLSIAFRLFVRFAMEDETRGWVLLRTMPLVGPLNEYMKNYIVTEFEVALSKGRFQASSLAAAVDIGLGMQIMTINRLLIDRVGIGYVEEAATMLLTALGLDLTEAAALANAPLPTSGPVPILSLPERQDDWRAKPG